MPKSEEDWDREVKRMTREIRALKVRIATLTKADAKRQRQSKKTGKFKVF